MRDLCRRARQNAGALGVVVLMWLSLPLLILAGLSRLP